MYEELINKLDKEDITVYSSGETDNYTILKAEMVLDLKFPKDYYNFLKIFGNISFGSFEINGISKTVDLETSFNGNVVGITLEAYHKYNLLPKVVLLGDAGLGDQYALNCNENSENYNKIFYWNPSIDNLDKLDYINDSFYDFFENRINKEISRS